MSNGSLSVSANSVVIVGLDVVAGTEDESEVTRRHFLCSGSDYLSGSFANLREISSQSVFSAENLPLFRNVSTTERADKVFFVLYPTKTYSTASSDSLFSDVAPEDRKLMRKVRGKFPRSMEYFKVPLAEANVFEKISGYLADDKEREQFRKQQIAPSEAEAEKPRFRFPIGFDASVPKNVVPILKSCITKPNKQDYFYVVTKSLGINMAIKITFATFAILRGTLPWQRAIITTIWYQSQDVFFTTFGQTYMKFLGKMSRMLRIGKGYFGDLMFTYIQFSCLEFINRLILGPVGENPLVYTWAGVGLILFNNFQGLISGGPMTPAIVRVRKAGVISHKTMMHIYQLGGLTFHFGLFASFGYQTIYTILTGSLMVLSWGFFLTFSMFFKDPEFSSIDTKDTLSRLDELVSRCANPRFQGKDIAGQQLTSRVLDNTVERGDHLLIAEEAQT